METQNVSEKQSLHKSKEHESQYLLWPPSFFSSLNLVSSVFVSFLVISLSSSQEQFSRLHEGYSNIFFGCSSVVLCPDDPTVLR